MNQQLYIAVNGQQTGPFTIDELKTKNIQRETLIWTEGLDNWTRADHIPILKDVLNPTPPPIPVMETKAITQHTPPPPIPTSTPPSITNEKYFGYELAFRRERLFAAIVETLILGIPFLVIEFLILSEDFWTTNYGYFTWESFRSTMYSSIFGAFLGAIFYPMWSGNLGHKIMGLKVISSVDGQDLNTSGAGWLRELSKSLLGYFIIPVIWLIWDDDRQNVYDKLVKTYVVRKK